MKQVDFDIIIPTLNEEHYIGTLLDSIAKQTLLPKDIVVVDAESKDKTIEEIKKRKKVLTQLRYFQMPKYSISRQRNFGIQQTKSDHILFLDADVVLKDTHALEDYIEEVLEKKPDVAIATNLPDSSDWQDKILFKTADYLMKLSRPIWPTSVAINMYVKRSSFEKAGMFDEEIRVAEDFELVQRMNRKDYSFKILGKPKIYSSVRRWRKHGRIRTMVVMWTSLFLIGLFGYRQNPIRYDFGKHKAL